MIDAAEADRRYRALANEAANLLSAAGASGAAAIFEQAAAEGIEAEPVEDREREALLALERQVRSFVSGMGFVAPEAMDLHVRERLVLPLGDVNEARR